jgi:hypothetical protein
MLEAMIPVKEDFDDLVAEERERVCTSNFFTQR